MADISKRKDLIRACYAPDARSADQMIAVLEQYGISAVKRGGVKDIYRIGGDVVGEEIMVAPEDLSSAREILQQMTGNDAPTAEPSRSPVKTVISLGAAVLLFIILLLIRGLF